MKKEGDLTVTRTLFSGDDIQFYLALSDHSLKDDWQLGGSGSLIPLILFHLLYIACMCHDCAKLFGPFSRRSSSFLLLVNCLYSSLHSGIFQFLLLYSFEIEFVVSPFHFFKGFHVFFETHVLEILICTFHLRYKQEEVYRFNLSPTKLIFT